MDGSVKDSKAGAAAIHLLSQINYHANDLDLKGIHPKISYLFSTGYSIAFLHIPSHKEIKYNEMADNFANKAADIPPPEI